jgi:hypothetical protein
MNKKIIHLMTVETYCFYATSWMEVSGTDRLLF